MYGYDGKICFACCSVECTKCSECDFWFCNACLCDGKCVSCRTVERVAKLPNRKSESYLLVTPSELRAIIHDALSETDATV